MTEAARWRGRAGRHRPRPGCLLLGSTLLLAACGSAPSAPPGAVRAQAPPTTRSTSAPPAGTGSGCEPPRAGAGPLTQGLDGTISGCLLLDARAPGSYTVSLWTLASPKSARGAPGGPAAAITLDPASGPPGTRITVTGHYVGTLPGGEGSHANACWDGCPTGLMEDGVEVSWSPDGTFTTTVVVPETAWLENGVAHPLTSDTYTVGVECLGADVKGCATMPAEASAPFHLTAPPPTRCVAHRPCGQLHLSPGHGVAGQTLSISGWAPLAEIIGQPFGYQTDMTAGAGPGVGVTALPKGNAGRSTVAEAALRIDPPPPWSAVDASHQLWEQQTPPAAVAAAPSNPRRFGYCATNSLRITSDGGATFSDIPTAGIGAVLGGTPYQPLGPGQPACSALALDPKRATIYAAVTVNPNGEAPPFETVGMLTRDAGRHWSLVPAPPGSKPGLFSDFRADAEGVDAVFNLAGPDSGAGPYQAGGAPSVVVQRSVDGGASWTPAQLACPGSGPCATFGGHWDGNCAMNGAVQTVQYSTDTGATWSSPAWPSSVNSCGSPQLAALSDGSLLLIDPASGYLVRRSSDGGRTWSYVGTPALPGTTAGQADPNAEIALLPDGDLLSVGDGGPWYLLPGKGASWCRVRQPSAEPQGQPFADGLPVAIGDRLWWLQSDPATQGPPTLSSRPLSSLVCAS